MTNNELQEVVAIIKKVIDKVPELKELSISINDFSSSEGLGNAIFWSDSIIRENNKITAKFNANDRFKNYFEKIAPSRKLDYGQFFHFLKFEYALSTLKNQEIQLSALSYLWENDPLEQVEFQKRHAFIHDFSFEKVEAEKNKIFVYCFSDSYRNEASWESYGNNETGIALGFRFIEFSEDLAYRDIYQLKDVIYDKGYDFDFIDEIQFRLYKRFKRILFLDGLTTLSKFYKRYKYNPEREIRLCFDYDINRIIKEQIKSLGNELHDRIDLEKHFAPNYDSTCDRHFIRVPFRNSFFTLKVTEIICGKSVNDEQIFKLRSACDKDTMIWRRT